jgi:O-antigen ligase
MSPSAAVLLFALYIGWLLASEVKRRDGLSAHLWVVVVWVALLGSRPVTSWFTGGFPTESIPQAYDEGNVVDRWVYLLLIFYGISVLLHRRVQFTVFVKENPWLFLFFLYWLCSVLWADSPFIAFKRWFKDLGNIVMALVVLTEARPADAAKALFARCALLLVPVSLLLIKYFPELGRVYHVTGELLYTGVATHKNSLGMMLMVCGMFLIWDWLSPQEAGKPGRRSLASASLLALTIWLLVQSKSATSIACATMGAAILLLFRSEGAKRKLFTIQVLVLTSCAVALTDWASDVLHFVVVDLLDRNMTLTTRTDFWPLLMDMSQSAVFGSGFGSFWTGDRLMKIYNAFGISQAHNGYLETYLNGGFVALALLTVLLLSAWRSANRDLVRNEPFGLIRIVFVMIMMIYNITEASFDAMSILWFAFVLNIVRYPAEVPALQSAERVGTMPAQPSTAREL